ncbi:MAG: hypothetical protein A4S09_06785 [Proteobacteria bacterium SG_bin7]|nr:MAG: hypothetical protein A4S09_06785 [Proteobacteria bacterium SG_bin7]
MIDLSTHRNLIVRQVFEVAEWFGFETRNKYEILDEHKTPVAYAAEQQKGFFGWLLRQFLGHWRSFDIHIYNSQRQLSMTAHHPFRFIFQRLEVKDNMGRYLGCIQQRFSLISKRFDVQNARGMVVMEVASPIWRIWTFEFFHGSQVVAAIRKKWSGVFSEMFTDRDNFLVEFNDPTLSTDEKQLVLAAAIFVDLKYFENKAGK